MSRDTTQLSDATLRLLLAPGIGPATLRKLRATFGSDEAAASAGVQQLMQIEGIGRTAVALRAALDEADPDAERRLMIEHDVRIVLRDDQDYPVLLRDLDDAPEAMWVRGELKPQDCLALAIVGSRKCSVYGREQAGRFASLLAESGLTIISGGALGIDAAAHRGALRVNGRTIVVLGCGLSTVYPPEHDELFAKVVASGGAIVAEHPMLAAPVAQNFPRRNRIISGMSLGVLVIEAAKRSGALITARLAAEEHGREVMAVPGRVDSPASAGCLELIQKGGAALVINHADVLQQLEAARHLVDRVSPPEVKTSASSPSLFDGNLTEGQTLILHALTDAGEPIVLDQLAARTQRPLGEMMADLTLLEIRGRIARDHRGIRIKQ